MKLISYPALTLPGSYQAFGAQSGTSRLRKSSTPLSQKRRALGVLEFRILNVVGKSVQVFMEIGMELLRDARLNDASESYVPT